MLRPRTKDDHPAVGTPAPELDLVQLIAPSDTADASDPPETFITLKGEPPARKVTLLHFWGTWCPPCLAEYPQLVDMLKQKQSDKNLQFISVSCEAGPGESFLGLRSKTFKYYQKIDAGGLATYIDAQGNTRRQVAASLGNRSMVYPTTVLIGPDQRIAGVWEGYSDTSLAQMETMINQLLSDAG